MAARRSSAMPNPQPRLWRPKRVLATPSALAWPHGRAIVERVAALGIDVVELPSDRVMLGPNVTYAEAKSTLAIVTASPSQRRLQPIAPSADWRVDLAQGCPAHCSYCYLAGSLKGPPITRVYANLPEIMAEMPPLVGQGKVTSRSRTRAHEGTTFEASCYTDPLAIEHLTGSLAEMITRFGAWDADVQLRFTSKFDAVEPLLGLQHNGRTRMRFSVSPALLGNSTTRVRDYGEALDVIAKACDGYDPMGCLAAGTAFASRDGADNRDRAKLYFERACGAGVEAGCQRLAGKNPGQVSSKGCGGCGTDGGRSGNALVLPLLATLGMFGWLRRRFAATPPPSAK